MSNSKNNATSTNRSSSSTIHVEEEEDNTSNTDPTSSSSSNKANHNNVISNDTANYINPYAVLNLSSDASIEDIQKSYKSLSRSFHPDKQPPGENRDVAQKYFIQFKSSYDILMDPVLRLGYDMFGMKGVQFLRKSVQTYKDVEEILTVLMDPDDSESKRRQMLMNRAKDVLSQGLQYYEFVTKTYYQQPSLSADITLKCNSTHSIFFGEGVEPMGVEVEEMRMNLSVAKSPGAKTSLSFAGHSGLGQGQGSSGIQLSWNYEPVQQTVVNIDCNVGPTPDATKLTLGTSHVLANQTYVAANITTLASRDVPWGLSLTSHRSMMENSLTGTWIVGVGLPTLQMQYGLLSFTSHYPNQPKYTAKFNIGMDYTPIKLSMEKTFDEEKQHVGKLSWGWGPRGIDLKAVTVRSLSKYCKVVLGLHHVSYRGLTWIFQLERGTVRFTVPVLVTTVMSPAYALKSMYMTLLLGTLDATLGDIVQNGIEGISKNTHDDVARKALLREEALLEREKIKRDALHQLSLMEKPANVKRRLEEEKNGLVILKAIYSAEGGDSIDVTTALMFWVMNGQLYLPSTAKSSMLGFYDVRRETPLIDIEIGYMEACWRIWNKLFLGGKPKEVDPNEVQKPRLTIRYRHQGHLYEVTILDDEELSLPSPRAMKLGDSRVS